MRARDLGRCHDRELLDYLADPSREGLDVGFAIVVRGIMITVAVAAVAFPRD
jgi:hypothetical protein